MNGVYDPHKAHLKAQTRKKYRRFQYSKIEKSPEIKQIIIEKLKKHWNPDEIAGWLKDNRKELYVSKSAIYNWLHTGRGDPTGAFQLVNHADGTHYHFNTVDSLDVVGTVATFTASGWMQGGNGPVNATFVITDNGEPGKNKDTVVVTSVDFLGPDVTISGGNFQVVSGY